MRCDAGIVWRGIVRYVRYVRYVRHVRHVRHVRRAHRRGACSVRGVRRAACGARVQRVRHAGMRRVACRVIETTWDGLG